MGTKVPSEQMLLNLGWPGDQLRVWESYRVPSGLKELRLTQEANFEGLSRPTIEGELRIGEGQVE